jgi:pimeloyl-ACP methyl ester carboxylesterase
VNFHNEQRAPLLFIAGGADHIMPPSVNRSNAHHYKAPGTITEYHEFPGRSHWTCAEPGWEQVADYALDRALRHSH